MTACPDVPARFVPSRHRRPGDAVGDLVVTCPWCGKTHRHGAGADPAHLAYGHRLAHCAAPGAPRAYTLVPEATP